MSHRGARALMPAFVPVGARERDGPTQPPAQGHLYKACWQHASQALACAKSSAAGSARNQTACNSPDCRTNALGCPCCCRLETPGSACLQEASRTLQPRSPQRGRRAPATAPGSALGQGGCVAGNACAATGEERALTGPGQMIMTVPLAARAAVRYTAAHRPPLACQVARACRRRQLQTAMRSWPAVVAAQS